jgi:DNA-binding SARP family transcriptional activator
MHRLDAFGDPVLRDDSGTAVNSVSRQNKKLALLIFLSCDGSGLTHRREEVMATFWPESDGTRGRNALRQSLHVLRSELGPHIIRGNGTGDLWIDHSQLTCDVDLFRQAIAAGSPEAALKLYKADFLRGFVLRACPGFGAWADELREDLRETAAKVAKNLAHQAEEREDSASAVFWWQRALRHRPFDEVVICRIMSLLAWGGNRGEAFAEFDAFSRRLRAQLGLGPSPETLALLEKISLGHVHEIPRWIGDRRARRDRKPERHWRRPADHSLS